MRELAHVVVVAGQDEAGPRRVQQQLRRRTGERVAVPDATLGPERTLLSLAAAVCLNSRTQEGMGVGGGGRTLRFICQ